MKRKIAREVLSAHDSWLYELRQEGFTPDDFDFEETVDAVMEKIDHSKFPDEVNNCPEGMEDTWMDENRRK